MTQHWFYPIGNKGVVWNESEKKQWFDKAITSRSYHEQVVNKLHNINEKFLLQQYGALTISPEAYPLFALQSKNWDVNKPVIIITGGVHGYETSGVQGAIEFVRYFSSSTLADDLSHFNIAVLPCVSPWGYEHIARWNPHAVDPNRSFVENSPSEEAAFAMAYVKQLTGNVLLHIDLHETTDTDESEFRPALAARDGEDFIPGSIPDGFYLVGDAENKQPDLEAAIINTVKKVTHIAPADDQGEIIGSKAEGEGIIYYDVNKLGLCAGMTNAKYTITTEVYPDSENATDEDCNKAQIASIEAALSYLMAHEQ